jgi:AcrR family transcriptional regulator
MPKRPRTTLKKQAQQERSKATVDAILKAASHILVKVGYDKTSTTRIAARAGVSVGSLYQYFPGKEAIVAELIDRHIAETFDLMTAEIATLAATPIEITVRRVVELLFRAYSVDPTLHRVFVEQVPRVGRLGRLQEVERTLTHLTTAYLAAHRDEVRPINPELAAFVVIRAVAAVAYSAVTEREGPPREAVVAEISELALRYLR